MAKDPEKWTPPLIAVVGIGTGPKTCSAEALRWIEKAEVLVGGGRHLEFFATHSGEKILLRGSVDTLIHKVASLAEERRVAVLASGDPLFFGIGRSLSARLPSERLRFVPGPTSVQCFCAALGRPWDDLHMVSLHGREPSMEWMWFLRRGCAVAFLTDQDHPPQWIATRLLESGFERHVMLVGEDLGLPSEKIRRYTPEEAAAQIFSPLNVILVIPPPTASTRGAQPGEDLFPETEDRSPGSSPQSLGTPMAAGNLRAKLHPEPPYVLPGIDDEAFVHREGLITKKEVRSVALSMLRPAPGHILWDLGAGSGSVAVEASLLHPLKSVWAVERVPERAEDIRANVRRFHCGEIQVIVDDALEAVSRLPTPDRVFVGGAGGALQALLEAVWDRLKPSGRVVIPAVTWHTVSEIEAFSEIRGIVLEAVQVQVSRAVPIGSSRRFEALNPVVLCALEKRSECM